MDNTHFRGRVTLSTYEGFDNDVSMIGDAIAQMEIPLNLRVLLLTVTVVSTQQSPDQINKCRNMVRVEVRNCTNRTERESRLPLTGCHFCASLYLTGRQQRENRYQKYNFRKSD